MIDSTAAILLVEDNDDDEFLMKRALAAAGVTNPLRIVRDGEEAVQYLGGEAAFRDRGAFPLPQLVFLDLKLPLRSGLEVLEWIRGRSAFDSLIVVVLTSSAEPADMRRAYQLGANSYLVKPLTTEQLKNLALALEWEWAGAGAPGQAGGGPAPQALAEALRAPRAAFSPS
ncbi:MAG TPA: response regulator [Opitutaceae bacterium]|nr:response regulator [Opitutaceae bacterium]